VPGVQDVQIDMNAKSFVLRAKTNATLSPRAVWEAVEGTGEKPTKLTGPNGTYTAKPPA
jgi:hypothetical protein